MLTTQTENNISKTLQKHFYQFLCYQGMDKGARIGGRDDQCSFQDTLSLQSKKSLMLHLLLSQFFFSSYIFRFKAMSFPDLKLENEDNYTLQDLIDWQEDYLADYICWICKGGITIMDAQNWLNENALSDTLLFKLESGRWYVRCKKCTNWVHVSCWYPQHADKNTVTQGNFKTVLAEGIICEKCK